MRLLSGAASSHCLWERGVGGGRELAGVGLVVGVGVNG